MSTTERKLFSYDRVVDADIHNFLGSLPSRQQSKYIRMAIRLLRQHLENGEGEVANFSFPTTPEKKTLKEETNDHLEPETKEKPDDFEDIHDDFLDIGR
ncbi:hypothetical protein [Bacillus taeanensis]|uniref:Uncharacterized protein n=1 Tax=Bacillus taeanensis TaxID=273032 RepID=A0A366XTZ9_9BACI|nr:hypothetical protein [Bacillus taeanensis]RBW68239.1 hypothetical protein DS031_17850 [Bacillus taeanensis]